MRIDLDRLAEELGLPTWDKWSESFDYSEAYSHAHKEAYREIYEREIDQGVDETEADATATEAAEQAGQEAEQAASEEEYHRYYDNLMYVAEKVFEEHGLKLVPTDPPGSGPGYQMRDDLDGVRTKRKKRR